jgi:hypothetical protein
VPRGDGAGAAHPSACHFAEVSQII